MHDSLSTSHRLHRRRQHGARPDRRPAARQGAARRADPRRRAADAGRRARWRATSACTSRPTTRPRSQARRMVVLAVKPQDMARRARARCAPALRAARAAGALRGRRHPHRRPAALVRAALPVVRAMPNRPALLGAGATGLYAPPRVSAAAARSPSRCCAAAGRTCLGAATKSDLDIGHGPVGQRPGLFLPAGRADGRGRPSRLGLDAATRAAAGGRDAVWRRAAAPTPIADLGAAARRGHLQGRHHRGGARRCSTAGGLASAGRGAQSTPPRAAAPSSPGNSAPAADA